MRGGTAWLGVLVGSAIACGDDAEVPYEEPRGCIDMEAPVALVSFAELRDDQAPSCGSEDQPDIALRWRAPQTGRYLFHATEYYWDEDTGQPPPPAPLTFLDELLNGGSYSAPAMALLEGDCEGRELLCAQRNVSLEEGSFTRGVLRLERDQVVTVVLEPTAESRVLLASQLAVGPVACGENDLGSSPSARIEDWGSGVSAPIGPVSCTPDEHGAPAEHSWRYRAPSAGRYRATLQEMNGETVALAVFDAACLDERDCALGEEGEVATLELDLGADEEITLVVSARNSGDRDVSFTLAIELVDP